jgi:hypothetical protein
MRVTAAAYADTTPTSVDETPEVEMDEHAVVATRRSLHAVAERLLAGPQYREHGEIRLQVTPGGFGQFAGPLRVEGTEIVGASGRVPLRGRIGDIAAVLGIEAAEPADLYSEHAQFGPDDELAVDPAAAGLLLDFFRRGDQAMRRFAPSEVPILWPEHFDLGISLDEVNYGVSPGDGGHALPYAYVGPWAPREGEFWNASFGADRAADQLPDTDAVVAFFVAGRAAAAG